MNVVGLSKNLWRGRNLGEIVEDHQTRDGLDDQWGGMGLYGAT